MNKPIVNPVMEVSDLSAMKSSRESNLSFREVSNQNS